VNDRASGQRVARYRYNSAGQRVAKTVFRDGTETTTYTLWQDGLRVAEIDATGNITAQTLYLSEGQRATPVAQLDGDAMFAIHVDQRGAPIAMTDSKQAIVWRATISPWGTATPANGNSFGPASMNLRLPGQVYDAETGLHDNGFRTYDPLSGNYLQPDPLGHPDGPDAYRYAGGDPLNRVDPAGLYAIDVHYYMTYFLALTAGLDDKTAWVVATAAQTIDDVNPYTDAMPFNGGGFAQEQREKYHFTQPSTVWEPLNDQTSTLLGYATNADNPCLKAQFFGEFMHAYQDTFGHRDRDNVPYAAFLGHAIAGTQPDLTYNDPYDYDGSPLTHGWYVRETRTFLMEQAVFAQMQTFWGTSAKDGNGNPITFESIMPFLEEWNKIKDDDVKIKRINYKLKELGFQPIENYETDGSEGLACRLKYFQEADLIGDNGKTTIKGIMDYSNAILNTKTQGATTCKY